MSSMGPVRTYAGWDVPLNGLMAAVEAVTGLMWGFHAYILVELALLFGRGA